MGLGIVGPIVGSHIVKVGLEGSAVTGILAVIGAALLTSVGSVRLIRSATTTPRKLLALPVAFVLLQFVVLPLSTAVYTTQAAHPRLGSRVPSDLGLVYEDVSFKSDDGTTLSGWYIRVAITRKRGPLREAKLPAAQRRVTFGVHSAVADCSCAPFAP